MLVINGDAEERIALLVTEIQNGNVSAFDELYRLTNKKAYGLAKTFLRNEFDAKDILQESYIKALSKIKELEKPERFQSWLNQIVANKCRDFLRRKKSAPYEIIESDSNEALADGELVFNPEENLDKEELQRTVMEVIDELNEEKRACVLMMYFEELSVGEIAETLEIPEGTVKTRLFSARKDLREKFAKRGVTSAYSLAPMGVVLWAVRKSVAAEGTAFAAGPASASVLAGITASGVLAATGTAAAVTGGGIAAKIAALTVAQKVIAGVSVAAVVAGGSVGIAAVVGDGGKKTEATTAYVEEYTTAPYEGTTVVIQAADGTVEFTLTDPSATNGESAATVTSGRQTSATQVSASASTKPASTTKSASTTRQTTTKPTTTRQTATEPTTRPATTKPTTKPTTTKPTTTKATTTLAPTTKGKATIEIKVIDLDGKEIDKLTYTVDAGTEMTNSYLWNLVESKGYSISGVFGSAKDNAAQAGKTYTFEAEI